MPLIPISDQNIQNDLKVKKKFQKVKKSFHPTKNISDEGNREQIAGKLPANANEKQEKKNIYRSDINFLMQSNNEQDTKVVVKEKSFTSTLQDFPELKVFNPCKLSNYNVGNCGKFGYNKSWSNKKEKIEAFPPLLTIKTKAKGKADFSCEKNRLPQTVEVNVGICDVSKEHCTSNSNLKNDEEKELSLQDTPFKSKIISKKKKRTDPVFINFKDVLKTNKTNSELKKSLKSKTRRPKNTEHFSGNYLDSSNPKRLRGKYREVKKERLTKLKLAIIKERIIKEKLREKSETDIFGNDSGNFSDSIDFKSEIKMYLNKLSQRKLKQTNVTLNNKIKKNSSSEDINTKVNDFERIRKVDKMIPSITPEGNFKFSSKFREYCDNVITPNLNSAVSNLIMESVNLQDKLFLQNPIKAKAKKRHVTGIREVRKYLVIKKVKLIVIAPNLEKLQMEGSLHDVISDLKSAAQSQNVPYVFALDRYKLGRFTKKNLPVSAFAILSYEGIEGLFSKVLDELQGAREKFNEISKPNSKKEEDLKTAEINDKIIASFISAFQEELQISGENSNSK